MLERPATPRRNRSSISGVSGADALTRLLTEPTLAQAMGRAGRKRVEEQFSWTSVAERTQHLYADAVDDFKRQTADE